jgi:tetratricopeptide (TPR) repeat protein
VIRRIAPLAASLASFIALSAPANADVAKARAHYERGQALYQLGEYHQALDEFKAAHVEKTDPAFLYNIAQCYRLLDQPGEALVFYKRYLSLAPVSALRPEVERRIAELEAGLRARQPSPPPPASRATSPSPASPRLKIETPNAASPEAPGVVATVAPETPLPRWVPWTGAATTVALATAATVIGLSANGRYDDLAANCGQTPAGCSAEQIDGLKTRAHAANIMWALAGVAAIGTGVTVYVNTKEAGLSGVWRF